MNRYLLAGLCVALGFVLSMLYQAGTAPAEAAHGGPCCTPCSESCCQASTQAQPAKPPSSEPHAASHFVHFALDGLTYNDDTFSIKRIEFQYKGEGIIDSHIVQLAKLAARSEKSESAVNLKKVLSALALAEWQTRTEYTNDEEESEGAPRPVNCQPCPPSWVPTTTAPRYWAVPKNDEEKTESKLKTDVPADEPE